MGTSKGQETSQPLKVAYNGSTAHVAGLKAGTSYYFVVRALNEAGAGPPSNEVAVHTKPVPPPPGLPGPPTELTVTAVGSSEVDLRWVAPASDGGSAITTYKIYVGTSRGGESAQPSPATIKGTTAKLTGLKAGTSYYFVVRAVNAAGPGAPSNEVAVHTKPVPPPPGLPGPPTELTVTAVGSSEVDLRWVAPASDGGSAVSGYNVYQGTSPGGETGTAVNGSLVTATSYTVTGLVNGTTYYFKVTAVNGVGEGPGAEVKAVPVTVPGPPARLAAVHGNGQVTLSWAAPASDGGSPVTGYDLYEGTTADFHGSAPLTKMTVTGGTVTGLVNGTTYYFKVTAVNGVGEGPGAEVKAVPVTVPGPPARLAAVHGNGQVTLSWAAPASDGGSPVTGYIIYQGTNPGGENGTPVNGSPVTATSYTVTGLANGTTYYFKVVAVNAAGLSPLSEEAPTTLPPTASPPSTPPPVTPPTGLTAAAGDTQVRLSWNAPVSAGGSPVISYKVYVATTPDVQGRATSGSINGTGTTVTGLHNGTVYYFMVTAVNATRNESPPSTEVSAEPVAAREPVVPIRPPPPPTQLIALLAAVAAMAAAAVFTLIARHRRQPIAVAQDVRAVPDTSRPDVLGVRDTGQEPTHTVRLEPHPGVPTTTIKEGGHDDH